MAKADWGTKRLCPSCGARFYDLGKSPAGCPKCGTKVKGDPISRYRRNPRPTEEAPKPEPVAANEGGEENTAPDKAADPVADVGDDLEEVTNGVEVANDLADPDADDDLIEDASDLGEDDDDVSEVREHIDEEVADQA